MNRRYYSSTNLSDGMVMAIDTTDLVSFVNDLCLWSGTAGEKLITGEVHDHRQCCFLCPRNGG